MADRVETIEWVVADSFRVLHTGGGRAATSPSQDDELRLADDRLRYSIVQWDEA